MDETRGREREGKREEWREREGGRQWLWSISPPCPEVSTRMVSEYKTKLQISESEKSRLEGTVSCRVVGGREGGRRGKGG